MLDFTWKLFSQTGNIEAYLLLKQLERQKLEDEQPSTAQYDEMPIHTKM